jgi:hypothetical protein
MGVAMQYSRKQSHVSRSAVFLCLLFWLLLPWDCASATIPKLQGSFTQFVADFQFVAEKSEEYVPPSGTEKRKFRSALTVLLKGKVSRAQKFLSRIDLEVVKFKDTTTGMTFYLIREKPNIPPRGWGLYAINPHSSRNIVLEIPHPIADTRTESQGAAFFLELSAHALIIAGTHRCANLSSSRCSGMTSVCSDSGSPERYRISDAAHSTRHLLQVAHETLLDLNEALVAVALHGFAKRSADPHAFVSDGTRDLASAAHLANQFTALLIEETGLTNAAQSCNDGSTGARLCGTDDIQGRDANGSPHACRMDAPATGRFLHIEQSLDFRTEGGAVESTQVLTVLTRLF